VSQVVEVEWAEIFAALVPNLPAGSGASRAASRPGARRTGSVRPNSRKSGRNRSIDPSAPYASEIRAALPHARIAVDHWHLVRLANEMVTEVRQRLARQRHGRRGIKADPIWAHRRMLLTPAIVSRPASWTGSGEFWPRTTRPTRSAPPGAAKSCCANCSSRPTRSAPVPTVALLRCLRPRRHGLNHPAGHHHRDLVASHSGCAYRAGHQRPHRGLQPNHQTSQACRLRISQHGQLPTTHHGSHRGHPIARTSSMTRPHPSTAESRFARPLR
jgi:hypothetical protein